MRVDFIIQNENGPVKNSIGQHIANVISKKKFTSARVAVAYATVSGTRQILRSFSSKKLSRSQWVIGLSDFITHPDALELLFKTDGASVKVADTVKYGTRYHPKIFQFGNAEAATPELTFIGSANMTAAALKTNVETMSKLTAEDKADSKRFDILWDKLWKMGKPLTVRRLADYRAKFEAAEKARKSSKTKLRNIQKSGLKTKPNKSVEVLSSDEAQLDPKLAKTCWIEVGKATAMGRELEFKLELANYFGLNSNDRIEKIFNFKLEDGTVTPLRLKYQSDNGMWRLQMNKSIPEVEKGLRPKVPGGLGRSPHVAIFTKTKESDTFQLKFILDNSPSYFRLQSKSEKTGTLGRTSARKYGWCD